MSRALSLQNSLLSEALPCEFWPLSSRELWSLSSWFSKRTGSVWVPPSYTTVHNGPPGRKLGYWGSFSLFHFSQGSQSCLESENNYYIPFCLFKSCLQWTASLVPQLLEMEIASVGTFEMCKILFAPKLNESRGLYIFILFLEKNMMVCNAQRNSQVTNKLM